MAAKTPDAGVVIAAGGAGRRFGGAIPKQFLLLNGVPLIARTIAAFERVRAVGEIVVVVPELHCRRMERLVRRSGFGKVSSVVPGGAERQDSVRRGLSAFVHPPRIVLVHDAVRPMVTGGMISDVIAAARRYGAAVTGTKVSDTIKVEERKGFFTKTLDRRTLWAVQTPQGFRFRLLVRAHEAARRAHFLGTDDGCLVERLGKPVRIVPGDRRNIKITTKEDLRIAEQQLPLRVTR